MPADPVTREAVEPTIDEQVAQLKAAGWICVRRTLWKAPIGGYFLGPHGAWKAMKRREAEHGIYGRIA